MIKLLFDRGGRPRANNDLQTLQNEVFTALEARYAGQGAFIVSGCSIATSGNLQAIAPGIVFLDGQLQRFAGVAATVNLLPAELVSAPARTFDTRPYPVGAKDCMIEYKVILQAPSAGGPGQRISILPGVGGMTWAQVQQGLARTIGEVQQLAGLTVTDYDQTGRGNTYGPAWGWALANGQNNTADLRGLFIVGANADRATGPTGQQLTLSNIADAGGEEKHQLTTLELPSHAHALSTPTANPGNTGNGNAFAKTDAGNPGAYTASTQSAGGDQPHENRPPFYTLAMRQWVGY